MITMQNHGIGGLIETLSDGKVDASQRETRIGERFTAEVLPLISPRGAKYDAKAAEAFWSTFSLRELYIACTGKFPRYGDVKETTGTPVKTSVFTLILTGGLSSRVILGYDTTSGLIGDKLVTPYNSNLLIDKFPGFNELSGIADVAEGALYPDVAITEKGLYDTTFSKRGAMVSVTEEAILFDQTGLVLARCNEVGRQLALDREKHIINSVCDQTGYECYFTTTGGSATLYDTAQLKTSNALVDYTDIENAALYLQLTTAVITAIGDSDTPITDAALPPYEVLVPKTLEFTARHIANTLTVESAPASSSVPSAMMNNPVAITVLSSPYLDKADNANGVAHWYLAGAGGFKRQFIEKIHMPLQVVQVPSAEVNATSQDIVAGVRARYKSRVFALDNKFVVKNTD